MIRADSQRSRAATAWRHVETAGGESFFFLLSGQGRELKADRDVVQQSLSARMLQSQITNIVKRWPADPVRPASVSVQAYLESCLPLQGSKDGAVPKARISQASLDAMFGLLRNRYLQRYPLPAKLRRPASNPDYYENVMREFQEAPNRSFMEKIKKRLAGMFRLS